MSDPTTRLNLYERALHALLARLRYGTLSVQTPSGRLVEAHGSLPGPQAVLVLHNWRVLFALLLEGNTGFATSYIAGHWSSPDLTALLTVCALNFNHTGNSIFSLPLRLLQRFRHRQRVNSRAGSKRNIMAHYDLGNEFFAAWLDETMLYSSALYQKSQETLAQAQANKCRLVQSWLDVPHGGNVLEIGCGWGALARILAVAGARVTGLTLSPAQQHYAQALIDKAALNDHVTIALRDYRDETGLYDRIVSIEMFEAVGETYWSDYFKTLHARLKPGGRVVLQIISIAAENFSNYRENSDFIQSHIFPGGMLPTKAGVAVLGAKAGLSLQRVTYFGPSYARTLADWHTRFLSAWPKLEAMGFDQRFQRLWAYYLCYCQAGFNTGRIDVGLYEFLG